MNTGNKQNQKRLVYAEEDLKLLSSVANELKLPLVTMSGIAALLNDQDADPETKELFKRLELSSDRMTKMIDGLLLANKIASNQLKLDFGPVNLANSTHNVVRELRPMALRYGCDFNINQSDNLNLISADNKSINLVLNNFLDTMIRSTRSEIIEVLLQNRKDQVLFTVRDDGETITAQTINNVIKRIGTASQPSKSLPATSGLSIYISFILTNEMNGKINAYSQNGRRSITFSFNKNQQLALL